MKKYDAIFLDRDGTINLDSGYINSLDDFKFYEYTFEALKNLKKITDRFCIITNQSGVARGLIDPDNLSIIHDHILNEFFNHDLNLIGIYYCTDHPDFPSKRRKPGVGMFLEASKDFDINLGNCLMIGDSVSDIEPAIALGMDTMLVLTGNGESDQHNLIDSKKPKYITKNILSGARLLNK